MKILIMGATSGLGLEVAKRLVAKGHTVGVAGRRMEPLQALAQEYPGLVVPSRIDICSPDAPALMLELIERMGGMDSYFHISGIGRSNPALDPALELAMVETNVVGFTRMVDTAFAFFRDRRDGRGRITAITSVAGAKGIGTLAAYSASKRYQQTYLEALRQLCTLRGLHIRFTDIRPGWIATPLLKEGAPYPMLMDKDYAVGCIMRAYAKAPSVAYVDWRWRLVAALWRLVPSALWTRLPVIPGEM